MSVHRKTMMGFRALRLERYRAKRLLVLLYSLGNFKNERLCSRIRIVRWVGMEMGMMGLSPTEMTLERKYLNVMYVV